MNLQDYNRVLGSTAAEFAETGLPPTLLFPWQIVKMNTMYSLPINETPTLNALNESPVNRLAGFVKTFHKEVIEGLDIHAYLIVRDLLNNGELVTGDLIAEVINKIGIKDEAHATKLGAEILALVVQGDGDEYDRQVLVMLADWFGDMVVYIRSEALKFGIPLESVLACIMGSNFTKLGEDGEPIKDANGKVQKGPNFMPPEQHIYATMFEKDALLEQAEAVISMTNELNAVAIPMLVDPISDVFGRGEEDYDEEWDDEPAHDETFALPAGDANLPASAPEAQAKTDQPLFPE